jgi:hypothetical protein
MNLWPYVAVSVVIIAFCAFLVWASPDSKETVIAIASLIAGWWFQSPSEMIRKAIRPIKEEKQS